MQAVAAAGTAEMLLLGMLLLAAYASDFCCPRAKMRDRTCACFAVSAAAFAALDPELKKQPGVLVPLPDVYIENEVENQPTSGGQPDTSCTKAAPIWSKVCANGAKVEMG